MNKQSALEKLYDFKNLILFADETRDEVVFNEKIEKLDFIDKYLIFLMGGFIMLLSSGILSFFLNEIVFLNETQHESFLILSVGLLIFGFVSYMIKKYNKKADICALELIEKLQEKYF